MCDCVFTAKLYNSIKKKTHVKGIFISPGGQLVAQQLEGIDSYNDVIERRYTPLLWRTMDGGTNGFLTLFVLQHGKLDLQRDKGNWGSIGGCGQIRWVEVCDVIEPRHAWEARPHLNGGQHFFIQLSLFT